MIAISAWWMILQKPTGRERCIDVAEMNIELVSGCEHFDKALGSDLSV